NHWAPRAGVSYLNHPYSMKTFTAALRSASGGPTDMGALYSSMPQSLKPHLRLYFEQAINGAAPLVVNCSAGQERTGIASALMLSALGIPRDRVLARSEEHTSELQSRENLVCRLLLEKKKEN